MRSLVLAVLALGALGACSSLPSWMGGTKHTGPKLEGDRVAILRESSQLEPDATLANTPIEVPAAAANDAWTQHSGLNGNLSLAVTLERRESGDAGDGADFEQRLVIAPVVGDGAVFAMDARGAISAHDAKNVSEVRWISPGVATKDEEPILGGGLAYDAGRIYATSGKGMVTAFDARSGVELWRQPINIPIRSAPRVDSGRVFVVTVDSQSFALDARNGTILWNHRGVNEGTGFLIEASPAIASDMVVMPYTSGEIHALHVDGGDEAWTDVVASLQRQTATSIFTGIGGDPVAVDGLMYVAGSASELAALQVASGRRVWEQPISSVNTPWVAGDYLYIVASDSAVICVQRLDGRIRWVRQLQAYANEEERTGPYSWSGPVMAGGRLLVVGAHGQMAEISPQDGSVLAMTEIPEGAYTPPVVAGGAVYLVTNSATLYALY